MSASLVERIKAASESGDPLLAWLGQAGFLLRTPAGTTVLIDPYLSDECERFFGLRRLQPPPISPAEVSADVVLITHWHEDHLDGPIIRELARPNTLFVGPPSTQVRIVGRGVPARQTKALTRGESIEIDDLVVQATFARHDPPGAIAEDAVGFILTVAGSRVYDVGDSEYDHRLLTAGENFDLCMVPINGTGGNMDAFEAAFLAMRLGCRAVMPMHFDMWSPEQYGEGATPQPYFFEAAFRSYGGTAPVIVPALGEVIALSRFEASTSPRARGENGTTNGN